MGVDYCASVVYGVPYIIERQPVSVTRYHEVTGVPYKKKVVKHVEVPKVRQIAKTFPTPKWDASVDRWVEELRHGGDDGGVVGICLVHVDPDYNESAPISIPPDIHDLNQRLRLKLTPHYTPQEVGWFMTHARLHLVGYGV